MATPTRRGWREQVQPGIHRAHSAGCPRSADRRPKGACPEERCSWLLSVGGGKVTIRARSVRQAAAERTRLMAEATAATAAPPAPYVVPAPSPARAREVQTLTAFAAEYIQHLKTDDRSVNTLRNIEDDLLRLILPSLGHLPLSDEYFDAQRIDEYRAELVSRMVEGELSHRAVCQALKTFRAMFAMAHRWKRLSSEYAKDLRDPKRPSHLERVCDKVLTLDQLNHLLKCCGGDAAARSFIGLAGKLGPRRGELAGLCWDQVDLAAGRVTFRQQIIEVRPRRDRAGTIIRPGYRFLSPTKGHEVRELWLPASEVDALRRWKRESGGTTGWVWPGRGRARDPRWPERAVDGSRNPKSFNQVLERCLEWAGMWDRWERDASGRPIRNGRGNRIRNRVPAPITVHGLRHMAASILLLQGRPTLVVSRMLGHASTAITEKTYSKFIPDEQFEEIARIWDLIA